MKLVKHGAEAKLYKDTYLGETVMVKERQPKPYRERVLDEKILKERIRTEAALLVRAKKAGVRTPLIKKIDLNKKTIISEFVEGKTLKEELLEIPSNSLELCKKSGEMIGKLHTAKIIHGDLTTSNIIHSKGGLVLLDFGLGTISDKLEDYAVDLLVFKKTFMATHYKIKGGFEAVSRAYEKAFPRGKEVLKHLLEVEARARYY